MSNIGRVLTVTLTVTDHVKADWIWRAHLVEPMHGVKVTSISDGRRCGECVFADVYDEDE